MTVTRFSNTRRWAGAALAASFLFLLSGAASATSVPDVSGDFLSSYTGPQNSDLDLLGLTAERNGTGVRLSALTNGMIGTTATGSVVWGVNRGSGFPGLISSGPPVIGPSTLLFDAVVVLGYGGAGRIRTFGGGGSFIDTLLAPETVSISGNSISAFIPSSFLAGTGFQTADYTYLGWTRSGLGPQNLIADLAPEGRSFTVSAVPETATWAMLIAGFGVVGAAARRRRALVTA